MDALHIWMCARRVRATLWVEQLVSRHMHVRQTRATLWVLQPLCLHGQACHDGRASHACHHEQLSPCAAVGAWLVLL